MLKKGICSFIGISAFLLASCGEENPAVFPIETSSNDISSSSSFSTQYSSSLDSFSSSIETSSSSWEPYSYGEITDKRDGQTYKTIKIGEQTWMAENLNFSYYSNGIRALCYKNSLDSCAKYGRLYMWSTAMDSVAVYSKSGKDCGIWRNNRQAPCQNQVYNYTRGSCPENWHIPTESDMNNIVDFANASAENLSWIEHYWFYGGNESLRDGQLSEYGYFWTSLETDSSQATVLSAIVDKINSYDELKQNFHFIRCVKDEKPLIVLEHGEMTDERDGQVYKTVKIGTQTWMAENLNYAYPRQDSTSDSVSWCYNNEPDSCAKYGRLYTWDAAMNSCPQNWHLPSFGEWDVLTALANEKSIYLKSTSGWSENGNGSDIFGFGVLPGGIYKGEKGMYGGDKEWIRNASNAEYLDYGYGDITSFWTTGQFTYVLDVYTYDHADAFSFSSVNDGYPILTIHKSWGLSVRCVKDAEASE